MKLNIQEIISGVEKYPFKKRIAVFSLMCIAMGGLYFYFFFQPKYKEIKNLKGEIVKLDQDIHMKKTILLKLPKIKRQVKEKEQIFYYAKKLLPDSNEEVENLLANIEALGNEVGVEFILFQPKKERLYNFYAVRYVDLRLRGYFPNLMMFFAHISNLNRLVTVEDLTLSPRGKNFILGADCTLAIYRSLTPKEMEKLNKQKKKKKNG